MPLYNKDHIYTSPGVFLSNSGISCTISAVCKQNIIPANGIG